MCVSLCKISKGIGTHIHDYIIVMKLKTKSCENGGPDHHDCICLIEFSAGADLSFFKM